LPLLNLQLENWLHELHKSTTGDGSKNSNLDCSSTSSPTCYGPSADCTTLKPRKCKVYLLSHFLFESLTVVLTVYFVHQMAAQVFAHMREAHRQLEKFTIEEILSIDSIIYDFSLEENDDGKAMDISAAGMTSVHVITTRRSSNNKQHSSLLVRCLT